MQWKEHIQMIQMTHQNWFTEEKGSQGCFQIYFLGGFFSDDAITKVYTSQIDRSVGLGIKKNNKLSFRYISF